MIRAGLLLLLLPALALGQPEPVTITLGSDLKAGTYQVVPAGLLLLDPKMTLEELADRIHKARKSPGSQGESSPAPKSRVPSMDKVAGKSWDRSLLPAAAELYTPTPWTQSIYTTDGFTNHHIDRVSIAGLESKWHQSGGMAGVKGVKSEKYRALPRPAKTFVGDIPVLNSLGSFQNNRGLKREYADGSRFDDVLSHDGKVFEHRTREKKNGKWRSAVVFSDEKARPHGYTGLTATCASCHDKAGTGGYAVGMVPGGDTVLSDPLDWSLVRQEVASAPAADQDLRKAYLEWVAATDRINRQRRLK